MRNDMFMITCAARTGSTLLKSYLSSHPDTMVHGEVYPPTRIGELTGRYSRLAQDEAQNAKLTGWRDENQTAFLYKYIYDPQGKAVVGHKLKHEELLLPKFAETREAVRRDTDIRIIHLYRQNLFQRFASWWIVNHVTGVTMLTEGSPDLEFKTTTIPIAECQKNFDDTTARYQFFSQFFAKHRKFDVTYEDLISDKRDDILAEISEFLGIPNVPLTTPLRKVSPKDLRSVIENYDEIVDHFADTKYGLFFEETA